MGIRTTHTGSLPRADGLGTQLIEADAGGGTTPELEQAIRQAVTANVSRQAALGLYLINDGEASKIGYATYVKDRLTGFDGEAEWPASRRPEMDDHPDFARVWTAGLSRARLMTPACTGPIRLRGLDDAQRDIDNLRQAGAAAGLGEDRLFLTAASPGVISHFFANHHYPSRHAFLEALGEAMRAEYRLIVESGILLQVDCPDLAMSRHSLFSQLSVEEFRREAAFDVEVLNHALEGLPPERVRMHVCWGNYEGPHTYDVELAQIIDVVLGARPAGIVLEAANPRHAHEWQVFEETRLPDGKYLVPGVIDSTTNYVEHPDAVAQRLLAYARVVGPERVMGGVDCGFGSVADSAIVVPSIVWAKLGSLVEGARRASETLRL
jgi:5-methyltetrahydropteroyltriglutamate--homocysteine methyltransferase